MKKYKIKVRQKTRVTKSRKRKHAVIAVAVISAVAVFGTFFAGRISKFLLTSAFFNVKSTVVKGSNILDAAAVESYLDFKGRNIFRINLKKSDMLIMEHFPVIKSVKIRRFLPSSVVVSIEERVPMAESRVMENRVGLDENLKCFAISGGFKKLPEMPCDIAMENKAACMTFLKSVCDLPIYRDISNITAVSSGEIVLSFEGDKKVFVGAPENSEMKMSYLEQIISDLKAKGKNFEYINMKDFSADYKEATVKLR